MNDSEKRRRELLRQARQLYADSSDIPAVHPRYTGIYNGLYHPKDQRSKEQRKEEPSQNSTFSLRFFLALILFFCFVYMDQYDVRIARADSKMIIHQIHQNLDIGVPKDVQGHAHDRLFFPYT